MLTVSDENSPLYGTFAESWGGGRGGRGEVGRTEDAQEAAALLEEVTAGCSRLGGGGGGARATRGNRASGGGARPAASTVLGLAPVPSRPVLRCGVLAGILAPRGPL